MLLLWVNFSLIFDWILTAILFWRFLGKNHLLRAILLAFQWSLGLFWVFLTHRSSFFIRLHFDLAILLSEPLPVWLYILKITFVFTFFLKTLFLLLWLVFFALHWLLPFIALFSWLTVNSSSPFLFAFGFALTFFLSLLLATFYFSLWWFISR